LTVALRADTVALREGLAAALRAGLARPDFVTELLLMALI
jgi:hypothetical protein